MLRLFLLLFIVQTMQGAPTEQGSTNDHDEETLEVEELIALVQQQVAEMHGITIDNPKLTPFIGDIRLVKEQANEMLIELLHEKVGGKLRRKRYIPSSSNLWSSPIPYEIKAGVFTSGEEDLIHEAVQFWEDNTCLSFVEETQPTVTYGRIQFNRDGSGCWSYLGDVTNRDYQDINLVAGCFNNKAATTMHEIAHALGVRHEMTREDRDMYVTINFTNIDPGAISNFEKGVGGLYGTPYDYWSIMHYHKEAFDIDDDYNTIDAIGPYAKYITDNLGQRILPSFFDVKLIHLAYSCADTCTGTPITCQRGGIPDTEDSCNSCICPEGFGGSDCSSVISGTGTNFSPASGVLTAMETAQCITIGDYDVYDEAAWLIQTDVGSVIDLWFDPQTIRIQYPWINGGSSCQHFLSLKAGADITQGGVRFCRERTIDITEGDPMTSETNEAMVYFSANYFYDPIHLNTATVCYKSRPAPTTVPESSTSTTTGTTTTTTAPTTTTTGETTTTGTTTPTSGTTTTTAGTTTTTTRTTTGTTTPETTTVTTSPTPEPTDPPARTPCASSPCLHMGTCTNHGRSFRCTCTPLWIGDRCQTPCP